MRRGLGLLALLSTGVVLAVPAGASARTKVVYAGGPVHWANSLQKASGAAVNNFLINRVTINVGDTVDWNGASLANGFHTVDIPRLHGSDLPLIVALAQKVTGAKDAVGKLFWFNGKVPVLSFNPKLFGVITHAAYNGTQRFDSGLPVGKPADFKVTFSKAGVYKYYCDVHPGMIGYVIVKAKGKKVPTAKQDAAELKAEEAHYRAEALGVAKTKVTGHRVSLGASGPGGVEVYKMFPARLTVKKGTKVTFFISPDSEETHTASFGPTSYLTPLVNSFAGTEPFPQAVYPSAPPGHIVLTKITHGNGFANTGVLDRDPDTKAIPASRVISFNQKGTYRFICLIHPFMRGVIVVK